MIADLHVDLLIELAYCERRLGETNVFANTWLPLLDDGEVGLQVCPIWIDIAVQPEGSLREALSLVASFHRALAESPDRLARVTASADLDAVERGERLGLLLALEGVECFGVETWPADVFYELGVRMVGLTWNRRNAFADGAAEGDGGLSRLGRELVDRLVSLGVILDLAHASRGTFSDLIERATGAPLLCSHGGCRAVNDHPRNLDDDQLRALRDAGGIFGVMLHPLAIDPVSRTLDRVIDHLEHAASIIGSDRIALGGDFTKRLWEAMPPPPEPKDGLMPAGLRPGQGLDELAGSDEYPNLVAALARRGWSEAEIAAVTHRNALRFLRSALA